MPIEEHPPRRLKTQIERIGSDAKKLGIGSTQKVTTETIEAIMPNNQVQVLGSNVPVTGSGVSLAVGQRIAVAWTAGAPTAAIFNHAQAAQFVPTMAGGAPIVEELFIASAGGVSDVYFRNYDHVAALKLTAITGATYSTVKWGQNADHFIARRLGGNGQVWDIFKLTRNPAHPLQAHQTPAVSLVSTKDIQDSSMAVDTITLIFSGGAPSPQSVSIRNAFSIDTVTGLQANTGFVTFAPADDNQGNYVILDDRNHLITTWRLGVNVRVGLNPGGPFYDAAWAYAYVLDLTANIVLLNTYANPTQVDVAIGMSGVAHVSGTNLAGITNTLDPDGQNRSTLYFPTFDAKMGFVTDGAIDNVFMSTGYTRSLTTVEGFPHFGVFTGGAVVLHPSGFFAQPTVAAPLTAPVESLGFTVGTLPTGPTREHAGPLFNKYHVGIVNPTTNAAELVSFAANARADVDPSPSHFNGLGFIALDPDFLYVIEDETNPNHRFFVNAWNFSTGAITLSAAAPGFPPEDTRLKSVRTLAALPAALTLSNLFITASFHAINDPTILSPLGRFKRS